MMRVNWWSVRLVNSPVSCSVVAEWGPRLSGRECIAVIPSPLCADASVDAGFGFVVTVEGAAIIDIAILIAIVGEGRHARWLGLF